LLVYDEDCEEGKPNFERLNTEMLKNDAFKVTFLASKVFLLTESRGEKEVILLKNRQGSLRDTETLDIFSCQHKVYKRK